MYTFIVFPNSHHHVIQIPSFYILIFKKNDKFSYTGCLTSNDNKTKYYTPSKIKCTGEMNTFSNTGLHKVSYELSIQYGHQQWHEAHQDNIQFPARCWKAVSLVTYSVALLILSCSSFTSCTFSQ